jgi:hypothetical protein
MNQPIPVRAKKLLIAEWIPLIGIQIFLWSTFIVFWSLTSSATIPNPWEMTGFVFVAYIALAVGYWASISFNPRRLFAKSLGKQQLHCNLLMFFSSIHLLTYGLATLHEYNCLSISAIFQALSDPGAAYAAKFAVYQEQIDSNRVSLPIQLVVANFWLYYVGLIGISYWWNGIRRDIRVFFLFSMGVYILAFACIGTQKGMADVLLLCGVGFLLRYTVGSLATSPAVARRFAMPSRNYVLAGAALFLVYVSVNQLSRAERFGISERLTAEVEGTIWATLLSPRHALVVDNLVRYSSQGYAGLAHALTQPFEFSYGYGISPAAHGYAQQYLGVPDHYDLTYLARSEQATGWPGRMFWSTAFPWWASDVSFTGVVLLMFGIGWALARAWLAAVRNRSIAALVAVGLLFEALFYITANNQVLTSRTGVWAVAAVAFLHLIETRKNVTSRQPHGRHGNMRSDVSVPNH